MNYFIPETLAPMRMAPASSKTVAIKQACRSVNTLAPTDVPKEFATSLAPMPKAKMNATRKPTTTTHNRSESLGSIIVTFVEI